MSYPDLWAQRSHRVSDNSCLVDVRDLVLIQKLGPFVSISHLKSAVAFKLTIRIVPYFPRTILAMDFTASRRAVPTGMMGSMIRRAGLLLALAPSIIWVSE